MTPAATRLRAEIATIYGDKEKAARLNAAASAASRLRARGDEAERLLHASALLSATLTAKSAGMVR